MPIIAPIPRDERRLMQKTIHKTRDKNHARRLMAILMLYRGDRVSDVARTLCCARSSVGRWINWFTLSGIEGLKSLPAGRSRRWPFEHICTLLRELIKHSPGDFGYQRSRWSTELLAIKIKDITGWALHAGTVRRWLPLAGLVWRRAAPTLRIRDPHKDEKMAAIHKALDECSTEHPVFYEDEVDIHLNPKIGADWQLRGKQNALSHRDRMKNTIWPEPCTVAREKSVTLAVTARAQRCSMWKLLKKVRYFMETVSPFPGGKHGLAKV